MFLFCFRFLGDLTVNFDRRGSVVSWEGQPIYLDKSVPRDRSLLAKVDWYSQQVASFMGVPIGQTRVALYGGRPTCRLRECEMGSFLADALVNQTGAPIGIVNSGSFKASLSEGASISCRRVYSNEITNQWQTQISNAMLAHRCFRREKFGFFCICWFCIYFLMHI